MGSAGMYFGMDAMLGDLGLAAYRKTISDQVGKEDIGFLHAKNSLTLLFDNQGQLTAEDKAIYQAVGVGKYPPRFWPQFRRFEPGFFPWLPEERDAVFLAICLEQVVDVARRAEHNPKLLGPCDYRTFLSRIPSRANGTVTWKEEFISPKPMERVMRIVPKVDLANLGQVLRSAKKTEMIWEADCFFSPMPVGNPPEERPYYPLCYMITDKDSGFVFDVYLSNNDFGAGFIERFIEAVKKYGFVPARILIRQQHLDLVFLSLAAYGIRTEIVSDLPMIDEAREGMFQYFEKGPGRRSATKKDRSKTKAATKKNKKSEKSTTSSSRSQVYQFKVYLNHVNPSIWRRFRVKSDITLCRLSTTILMVMDWDGGHLHQFRIAGTEYGIPHDDYEEDDQPEDEREVRLCDLPQEALKSFTYEYDFGDGWGHRVVLEKMLAPQKGVKYPVCIAGERSCPPEDCGGPSGYEDFLEAIRDPRHLEHDSMLEWAGGEFDPEEFDVEIINEDLINIASEEKFMDGREE